MEQSKEQLAVRRHIIADILSSYYYRDIEGRKNNTTVTGFLFHTEKAYIKKEFGFKIFPITNGYNLISFNQNLNQ